MLKKWLSRLLLCLRSSVIEHLSCKQRVEGLTPFAGFGRQTFSVMIKAKI